MGDASYQQRLAESYHQARANPLWAPLETVLDTQSSRWPAPKRCTSPCIVRWRYDKPALEALALMHCVHGY